MFLALYSKKFVHKVSYKESKIDIGTEMMNHSLCLKIYFCYFYTARAIKNIEQENFL